MKVLFRRVMPSIHFQAQAESYLRKAAVPIFWVRSCLDVHSDSVHICTETFFIFQEILRAKSDSSASLHCNRRPMALPYP
jgi:hypothetical protein